MPFEQITNNNELLSLLQSLYGNKGYYVNVVTQDKLNKIEPRLNSIIIINFDKSNEHKMGHWVVIIQYSNYVLYADPYGQPPPELVLKFMRKFKVKKLVSKLLYNKRQVEQFNQEWCGWYCMKIIDLVINKQLSIVKVLKSINEKLILSYGKQLYKKYLV